MNNWQQDVQQFMVEVKELQLPPRPIHPSFNRTQLCIALMQEELDELRQAMLDEDIVEVADGIADLLYVTLYTANAYGLDMTPIFAEVQRSNMAKKGGPINELGKQLKPVGWSPPDIKAIVEAQQHG